jgi:hypothetical protein
MQPSLRRLAAWIGVLALVAALAPSLPGVLFGAPGDQGALGTICTAAGAGSLPERPDRHDAPGKAHCPVCLAQGSLLALPPSPIVVVARLRSSQDVEERRAAVRITRTTWASHRPRAPPRLIA